MAKSKNVYITPGGGSFVIWFSQGDVGKTAELSLRDESGYYEIPAGAVVKIAGTKPSGLGFNETVMSCPSYATVSLNPRPDGFVPAILTTAPAGIS